MENAHANLNTSIHARHQTAGGTYLVVADETEEFHVALNYAGKMAVANQCHIGVLYVMEDQGFQHWGNIEERLRLEQREAAERTLDDACKTLSESGCGAASIYIEDGGRTDALIRTIENDPNITMLILGGGTHSSNPGPLVSHFTGKGLPRLRVPVMIVPDHLGV